MDTLVVTALTLPRFEVALLFALLAPHEYDNLTKQSNFGVSNLGVKRILFHHWATQKGVEA